MSVCKISDKIISNVSLSNHISLNTNSTSYLKHFFLFMKRQNKNINNYEAIIKKSKYTTDDNINDNINDKSHFFPENIKDNIRNSLNHVTCYEFAIYQRTFNVKFISRAYNKKFDEYIKIIILLLDYISNFSDDSRSIICSATLDIKIFLSNEKKVLRPSNYILGPVEINSGYTYGGCKENNTIVIFRKEEWFKVLIHECIHAFGLEFSHVNHDKLNQDIFNIFPINTDINPFESYCETWAIIINSAFHAFFKEKNDFKNFTTVFRTLYSHECAFSYNQMKKVLKYMGLKYSDLYLNDKISVYKRNSFYKENTSVFSYFVLKTIIMQDLNKFIDFCHINNSNNNSNNIIKFNTKKVSFVHFFKLIKSGYLHIQDPDIVYNDHSKSVRLSIYDID